MVGDAPGFTWHTGHLAIAVPNEALDMVVAVADRYGARYLILDDNRPRSTDTLYAGETVHPRLKLQYTTGQEPQLCQVYEIEAPK